MYSLILDTSFKYLGVALLQDEVIIDQIYYEAFRKQSELLVVEINNILHKNNVKPQQIQKFYINNGPGSYTGVRMSLAVSKTFAFSQGSDVYLVSSLLAQVGLLKEKVVSLIDARANRFYFGVFENGKACEEERVLTIEEVKDYLLLNPTLPVYSNVLISGIEIKNPINPLGAIQSVIPLLKKEKDPLRVEPFYFKEAVV